VLATVAMDSGCRWVPGWSTFQRSWASHAHIAVDVTQYDAAMSSLMFCWIRIIRRQSLTKLGDAPHRHSGDVSLLEPRTGGSARILRLVTLLLMPGIQLGGGRVLPLNGDFLFEAAFYGNPILSPTWQLLDANATAQAVLQVPNAPWVVGLTSYVAGMTWNPAYHFGIATWSAIQWL
jgi:hypothetical protein